MPITNVASAVRASPYQRAGLFNKARMLDNYTVELNQMCAANYRQCVQACAPNPSTNQACLQKCKMTADICTFSPP